MSQPTDLDPQIAAAGAYEDLFVPSLFGEWAPRVAEAAGVGPGDRVLDVACGTGALARECARRAGEAGRVVGLDPNPGMLGLARRLAPSVEWREGVAEAIPFDDGSFDVVASQFGLMFFVDRERAVREMVRILAPGGRLAVLVWDALEHNPAYAAEVTLLDRVAGRPAGDALRAPFALGDPAELERLFVTAGAGEVAVTTRAGSGRFPSVRVMVEADLRGWLPVMGVTLDEDRIGRVLDEAERDLEPFVSSTGEVRFETAAHLVTAVRG